MPRAQIVGIGLIAALAAGWGAASVFARQRPSQAVETYDLLIQGGRVIDGSGNPAIAADIGVRGGRIAAIGQLPGAVATRIVDARTLIVAPGFIDLHNHADDEEESAGLRHPDPRRRSAPNLVTQGVTTVVVNPDGSSPWPIRQQRERIGALGIGPNAILLAGHNTIRGRALGADHRRAATIGEIERMRADVRQAMAEGAVGLSAGLEYVPGRWSTREEIVALVEETARAGGLYIAHERSAGDPMWYYPSQDSAPPPSVFDSVLENIEVAERTGARVVVTHIKVRGSRYWGASALVIGQLERARRRGVDIWADQYPYDTTGSDGRIVLIPEWALGHDGESASRGGVPAGSTSPRQDYAAALERLLAIDVKARAVRLDVAFEIERRGGADNIIVFDHPVADLVGKSLAAIARVRGISPVDLVLRFQIEGYRDRPGGVRLRSFSLSEEDIERFAALPWVATASDAGIALPEDGPAVHPRFYGTFPRKLKRYAVERGRLTVESAIRSATTLPAAILGLCDRGAIRPGYRADLVVIDLDQLADRATPAAPHVFASGIPYVIVNGALVVDDHTPTGALAGEVIAGRSPACRVQP
jgi:N-acyl-D-amino-acid deacylase